MLTKGIHIRNILRKYIRVFPVSCQTSMPYYLTLVGYLFFSLSSLAQTIKPQYSAEYWMAKVASEELDSLLEQGIFLDSITVAPEYYDSANQRLNEKGFMAYYDIKEKIYRRVFRDYLYLQHVERNGSIYGLFFSLAGFDDIEYIIVKISDNNWNQLLTIPKNEFKENSDIQQIVFNYDEGPKNIEEAKLLVHENLLIMERGHLYHSAYDMKADSVLVNEESPWHASNGEDKEGMNQWIKNNVHDHILDLINKK